LDETKMGSLLAFEGERGRLGQAKPDRALRLRVDFRKADAALGKSGGEADAV
jgi:hypothetical protein